MEMITKMLNAFEQAARRHSEAEVECNGRVCNRSYAKLIKVVSYLKENNSMDELRIFLKHENPGVRAWAATFLLPTNEKEASDVLSSLSKEGIHVLSYSAELTLREWRKTKRDGSDWHVF